MITTNPHLPPRLARFLAGTTATPEQVVAYLQPDPRPNDYRKRKLLRELSPLMGEGVQVARDWVVSGGKGVDVSRKAPAWGPVFWYHRAMSAEIDAVVEDEFWATVDLKKGETVESVSYNHRFDRAKEAWDRYKEGRQRNAKGDDPREIMGFQSVIFRALSWKTKGRGDIYSNRPKFREVRRQLYALIALDTWIASTPFGGGA